MTRVPVIRQMTSSGCGAACLAMMASHHGLPTSLAQASDVCEPGRDGLSALTILRGGRALGLRGRGLRVELSALTELQLPVILHWGFNHFVVLESWNGKSGRIVDPSAGRRTVTKEELDSKFTGVAITLEPSGKTATSGSPRGRPWSRHIAAALKSSGVRPRLGQILLASLLLALVGLTVPILTRFLINDVLPVRESDAISVLTLLAATVVVAYLLVSLARGFLLVWLQGKISSQLTLNFYEHTLSLPFRYFQQRGSGDLMVRLTSNISIQNLLTQQTLGAILDLFLVVAYGTVLVVVAWQFGLVAVVLGLVLLLVSILAVRPSHRLMQSDLEAQSMSEGFLVESLTGIETLKSTGTEGKALERWSDLFFTQLNLSLRRGRLDALVSAVTTTIITLAPVLLLLIGGLLVIEDQISLGTMLALQGLAALFLAPMSRIIGQLQQLQLAYAYLERIGDVVDATPEAVEFGDVTLDDFSGGIEFRDVAFRYSSTDPDIVEDISLTIEPGSKVALVGATGSGKSTFAKMVLGLLRPTSGDILYDGHPQGELDIADLRSNFGAVIQSAAVFAGSIRSNIAFANPAMPLDDVVRATKLAGLHEDIAAMPMGYETVISESGTVLSGGQRQRLALARALATRPKTLVLDEATSHLDAITEAKVMENLAGLPGTKIVCAHRLSTIVDSDLILVFKGGRIVQRGTHEEMARRQGPYLELIEKQLTEGHRVDRSV